LIKIYLNLRFSAPYVPNQPPSYATDKPIYNNWQQGSATTNWSWVDGPLYLVGDVILPRYRYSRVQTTTTTSCRLISGDKVRCSLGWQGHHQQAHTPTLRSLSRRSCCSSFSTRQR